MRTFVAVVPPPPVLAPLVRAAGALRGSFAASWVPEERLHVTLAFLGEVSEDTARRVEEHLGEAAAEREPFALRLRGGGAFPRAARARVLWAGLDGDLDALSSLARATRRAARAARVDVERKPYVPHVTVARLRRPADVSGAAAALDAVTSQVWTVTEVVLMRSVLGPTPSYEPLARLPLGYQA
ncbi:MAG TPA: RNA 2',3'-cyclic phosphodiesterase [Frankiaceae bacterium]|nr:RNA 2',3'-cyclic phosphodiesterase [Frankiaceae bacterium]